MEMSLKTNAFVDLDDQEMMNVDGGGVILNLAISWYAGYLVYKSLAYTYRLGYENGYYSTK